MAAQNNTQVAVREESGKFAETIRGDLMQHKFSTMLPSDVPVARFTEVVLRAVQEDPALMGPNTDKQSLFLACQRAASDGLLPDKREGALVMYGSKVQWQPMIGGLRKRLAAAGFDLRAECVYEGDTFDYDLGDNPGITHKAPPLGTARGAMLGAYAIATNLATGEKYREVMSLDELNAVAAVSRAGNGGPWKGPFRGEMCRKTVGKRLIKSLPIDDRRLQEVIARDNEQFDMGTIRPEQSEAAKRVQNAVRSQRPEDPEPAQVSGQQPDDGGDDDTIIDSTATVVQDGGTRPEF